MTSSRDALREGARLFDEGAFFDAHEVWEDHWRACRDPEERLFFQGLIQIAAGFHKLLVMSGPASAVRLLEKGLAKLEATKGLAKLAAVPGAADAEVEAFLAGVRACARAIEAGRFDRAAIPRASRIPKG